MTDFEYGSELQSFMNALAINGKWKSFATEQQSAMIERAFFDVSAYAAMIAVEFKMENEFCRRAFFEQIAHVASQYEITSEGKTILQESITGFGSRKYKDPGDDWLSPRAKVYLEQFRKAAESDTPATPDNPAVTEKTPVGPLRILH